MDEEKESGNLRYIKSFEVYCLLVSFLFRQSNKKLIYHSQEYLENSFDFFRSNYDNYELRKIADIPTGQAIGWVLKENGSKLHVFLVVTRERVQQPTYLPITIDF